MSRPSKKKAVMSETRGRLLHIVRDDDDGIFFFQTMNKVFDFGSGFRIQRRGRLIHQQHFRIGRERSSNTEPLLLPTR